MVIENYEELNNNYYTYREVQELASRSFIKELNPIAVPQEFALGKFKGCKYAYCKIDADKLPKNTNANRKKITQVALDSGLYISAKDALNLLQVSTSKWLSIRELFNLKEVWLNYYLKTDIDKIYKLQISFMECHLSVPEVKNIIKKNSIPKIQRYKVPDYAYTGKFRNRETAYNSLDIMYCILNGYAKDEYYMKNNMKLEDKCVRRNNLILTDSSYFKDMTFEEFSNLHYTSDELYEILTRTFYNKAEFIIVPLEFRLGKFKGKFKAYKKSDILELKNQQIETSSIIKITKKELEDNKYISFQESCDLLEIERYKWLSIRNELNIKEIRAGYTLREDVLKIIKEYNLFFNDYCNYDEATTLHPSPYCTKLDTVEKLEMPFYLRVKCFNDNRIYAYSRDSLKNEIEKYKKNQQIIDDSYTRTASMQVLGLAPESFDEAIEELDITSLILPNGTGLAKYYKKIDINNIKNMQQDFMDMDKYINYNKALSLCRFSSWIDSDDISNLVVDVKPWNRIGNFYKCTHAYPKEEFMNILKIKENYYYFLEDIDSRDPLKSFREKLMLYPYFDYIYLSTKYPLATKLMYSFFEEKILSSRASIRVLNFIVRRIVKYFDIIYEMLETYNVKDIHILKTENIMEFLLKEPSLTNHEYTLPFFNFVYSKIVYHKETSNSFNKKIFDINKINKKLKSNIERKELLDADVYDLEVFLNMISYCEDIKFHTDIVLKEITEFNMATHVSYWLFISINLNNAWRVGDISTFPVFDIEDILESMQIFDFNWFENNSLSLNQSRLILSRLSYNEYIVSKTKAYNGFFISDDLAPSVATAIVILILFRNYQISTKNNYLMQFDTKFNYPSSASLNKFFSQHGNEYFEQDFEFGANKTSSTLLTFISAIQTDECSESTLQLAQNIRAHKNLESLLNYLKLSPETLNILTRNLFNRGEFGYIYSAIANSLNLPVNTLKKPNDIEHITLLRELVSSPWEFEILSGVMNTYEKETQIILNKINEMNFSEIQEKFTNIALKKYPSKVKNIQCFIGYNNCKYSGKDCVKCDYAIPTLYSLNIISKKLVQLLLKYESTTIIGEKIKLSNSIFYYKKRLIEAISTYGKDLVYSYMQVSRDDFLLLLSPVKEPKKLNEEARFHIC